MATATDLAVAVNRITCSSNLIRALEETNVGRSIPDLASGSQSECEFDGINNNNVYITVRPDSSRRPEQ